MSAIRISKVVALTLMKAAGELFREGTGVSLDHTDDSNEALVPPDGGLMDRLNHDDPDLLYWANELLRFARVIHGILSNGLTHESEEEI